jgi:hypothetical protein
MPQASARLHQALRESPLLSRFLDRFDAVALPDAWLVAGCLAQTVWNLAFGFPAEAGIGDIDLIYHDPADLSEATEAAHALRLQRSFADIPIRLDVKNQARVHIWYERRFGRPILPHASSAAAIATFPATATSLGVRPARDGLDIVAPYGLDDLFALVVRPNKILVTQAVYEAKAARWRQHWPGLTIIPWNGHEAHKGESP